MDWEKRKYLVSLKALLPGLEHARCTPFHCLIQRTDLAQAQPRKPFQGCHRAALTVVAVEKDTRYRIFHHRWHQQADAKDRQSEQCKRSRKGGSSRSSIRSQRTLSMSMALYSDHPAAQSCSEQSWLCCRDGPEEPDIREQLTAQLRCDEFVTLEV